MRRFLGVLVAIALLGGCDFLNTTVVNNHDQSGGAGNPAGGNAVCAGLVASINVDSESGSAVSAGTNITFSSDPRDAVGNSVPAACKVGPVECTALGECTVANAAIAPSLEACILNANQLTGECQAHVCFAGVCGTSDPVSIQ